jgi:hypothetical protein
MAARCANSHAFRVASGFDIQVTLLWQGMAEIDSLITRFNDASAAYR